MTQRMAFILAVVVTAFLLVLSGGVIARVSQADVQTAAAVPVAPTPEPTAVTASEMAAQVQAIIQEREAAYRDLIRQANERLQAAAQPSVAAAPARAPIVQVKQAVAAPAAPIVAVSPDAAAGIAAGVAGGNKTIVRGPELVLFNGVVAYEVVFKHGSVYVDANSGQVLLNSTIHRSGGGQTTASTAPSGGEHDDHD